MMAIWNCQNIQYIWTGKCVAQKL